MKATCCRCGQAKEAHRRRQSYCLACLAAHMRARRPAYKDLPEADRYKSARRSWAGYAQSLGILTPQPCEICGEAKVWKFHATYRDTGKDFRVRWLCPRHHYLVRNGLDITTHSGELSASPVP